MSRDAFAQRAPGRPARSPFRRTTAHLALCSALLIPLLSPNAQACPKALPKAVQTEPVAQGLVTNGLPLTILRVSSKAPVAQVFEQVREAWQQHGHRVAQHSAGEWQVLSAQGETCNSTLQLKTEGGTVGFFGIAQLDQERPLLPRRLSVKLPSGVDVLTSVHGQDGGRDGTTIAFSTRRRLDDIGHHFQAQLDQGGWQEVRQIDMRPSPSKHGRFISAQKGREIISVVLWEEGLTRALLTLSEAP